MRAASRTGRVAASHSALSGGSPTNGERLGKSATLTTQVKLQRGPDRRDLEVGPLGEQPAARYLGATRRAHPDADFSDWALVESVNHGGPVSAFSQFQLRELQRSIAAQPARGRLTGSALGCDPQAA